MRRSDSDLEGDDNDCLNAQHLCNRPLERRARELLRPGELAEADRRIPLARGPLAPLGLEHLHRAPLWRGGDHWKRAARVHLSASMQMRDDQLMEVAGKGQRGRDAEDCGVRVGVFGVRVRPQPG